VSSHRPKSERAPQRIRPLPDALIDQIARRSASGRCPTP
jgi:hypothetical protein